MSGTLPEELQTRCSVFPEGFLCTILTPLQTPAWIWEHRGTCSLMQKINSILNFLIFFCCLYWRRELWLGEGINSKAFLKSNSPDKNCSAAARKTPLGSSTVKWWLLQHHKPVSKSTWGLKVLERHSWEGEPFTFWNFCSSKQRQGRKSKAPRRQCKAEFLRSNRNWKRLGLVTGLLPLLL